LSCQALFSAWRLGMMLTRSAQIQESMQVRVDSLASMRRSEARKLATCLASSHAQVTSLYTLMHWRASASLSLRDAAMERCWRRARQRTVEWSALTFEVREVEILLTAVTSAWHCTAVASRAQRSVSTERAGLSQVLLQAHKRAHCAAVRLGNNTKDAYALGTLLRWHRATTRARRADEVARERGAVQRRVLGWSLGALSAGFRSAILGMVVAGWRGVTHATRLDQQLEDLRVNWQLRTRDRHHLVLRGIQRACVRVTLPGRCGH